MARVLQGVALGVTCALARAGTAVTRVRPNCDYVLFFVVIIIRLFIVRKSLNALCTIANPQEALKSVATKLHVREMG